MSRPHPTEGDSGVQQECANGTIMTLRFHGAISSILQGSAHLLSSLEMYKRKA